MVYPDNFRLITKNQAESIRLPFC